MDNTHFKELIAKYLSGKITEEEKELLFTSYDDLQRKDISWDEDTMGVEADVKRNLYTKALKTIRNRENNGTHNKIRAIFQNWGVAAAIITVFSIAIYFYIKQPYQRIAKQKRPSAINDVAPGGNKAILTLADGQQIILDNANDGTITTQGNISISKSKDGQLVYKIGDNVSSSTNIVSVFNTITTPTGGQYQVILSDDTKVWLNANSSIKFPTTFTTQERIVEIIGEAYFEVSKDKKRPFKVVSANQTIEVLGTHFNVNAYHDEESVKTTLLEGSVKVSSGEVNRIIKPGEQAKLLRDSHTMEVKKVDPEEAVSWKNGLFMFDNEEIHSIMRKISRWYGVEVVYQNNAINETFGGTVSRFQNVSQVLKILEVTGTIHFKIEGRQITVMK